MERLLLDINGDESILSELVNSIVERLKTTPILLISGDLGAGKTTLAQSLFKQLGVADAVTSPTFNLVNVYHDANGNECYHFDLYRIKHPAELSDIGFEDYLDSGRICVVEWPEIIGQNFDVYPHLQLEIEHQTKGRRYSLKTTSN